MRPDGYPHGCPYIKGQPHRSGTVIARQRSRSKQGMFAAETNGIRAAMDNVDLNVLRQGSRWQAEGRRVVLGTITRTWGSAPRPVGSVVAVRDDGQIAGSVSGGCIEDDLVAQLRAGGLDLGKPTPLRYGVGAEEARRFGLPCGGT